MIFIFVNILFYSISNCIKLPQKLVLIVYEEENVSHTEKKTQVFIFYFISERQPKVAFLCSACFPPEQNKKNQTKSKIEIKK